MKTFNYIDPYYDDMYIGVEVARIHKASNSFDIYLFQENTGKWYSINVKSELDLDLADAFKRIEILLGKSQLITEEDLTDALN